MDTNSLKCRQTQCMLYLRTSSSAAHVGDEKDSEPRQREKCTAWTRRKGWKVVDEFRYPAVSGADALVLRKGFAICVEYYCLKHGIEHIIVESGGRFARNLVVQETGLEWLEEVGIEIISAEKMRPNSLSPRRYNGRIMFLACVLSLSRIPF